MEPVPRSGGGGGVGVLRMKAAEIRKAAHEAYTTRYAKGSGPYELPFLEYQVSDYLTALMAELPHRVPSDGTRAVLAGFYAGYIGEPPEAIHCYSPLTDLLYGIFLAGRRNAFEWRDRNKVA